MKQHVFKRSRSVDGKRIRAKTYSGRYRFDGDLKDTEVALGVSDKQVAASKLAEIVRLEQRQRQGLDDPIQQTETLAMPLKSLVHEWVTYLVKNDRKPHYCGIMEKFMGVLMRECLWRTVGDIRPDSFVDWRDANRDKAAKTRNEYLGCARAFLNWLVKAGRLRSNPLASVEKCEMRGKQVRNRRSLSHDEFLRLLVAGGEARGVVYAVAYYTGLRRSEIASLCWGDIDLASATVTIRAEHAKNKTSVRLPLHLDLREMLSRYFEACGSPGHSVKALAVPPRLRAYDQDLKTAGIPKRDKRGRVADFHSLRHSCATRLAAENVPLAIAMRLMRHSDPKLTAKAYVDQDALPLAESIAKLPGMPNGNPLSPHSSPDLVARGDFESSAVASRAAESSTQGALNVLVRRLLSHLGDMAKMAPAVGIEPTT
jgi:integrase